MTRILPSMDGPVSSAAPHAARGRVLIMGATGYVGGRLLAALESRGMPVRCAARRPEHLAERAGPGTQVVQADCLDPETLGPALEGVDTAYYLVHSLGSSDDFEERERSAAEHFATAAAGAGVRRIIFLGGLGDSQGRLSAHLRSRHTTGEILRASSVPTIEFRASIVIGSGSLSFEMVRALVERLPVMITPRWVDTPAQPIAMEDVIAYLVAALDHPAESKVYEIGGTDHVSYGDIMREYARQRGLRRVMVPVPVLTPHLSSLWLGLVTPVYARIGRKLIEGLRNPTVVRNPAALAAFDVRPRGVRDAIARALVMEDLAFAQTRWSDALSSAGPHAGYGGVRFGPRLVDSRERYVPVAPERAFAPVRRIGGATGWYHANLLWRVRGFLDLLVGGVGMRRGRRDPELLRVGDVLDFWRVEAVEPARRLLLAAEMKLPGRAWLEFEVTPCGRGSRIRQTAIFDPVGLLGLVYWYVLWPVHGFVFSGMLRGIARAARRGCPSGALVDSPGPVA